MYTKSPVHTGICLEDTVPNKFLTLFKALVLQ